MSKHYQRKVDNRMKQSGDIDFDTRQIRVNKTRSRGEVGGILDTIVHEETHRKHPQMREKAVKQKTTAHIKTMTPHAKQKAYKRYS